MINSTELMNITKGELSQIDVCDLYTNTLTPLTKMNYISTIKDFFGVHDLSEITIEQIQSVTPDVANTWAHKQLAKGNAMSTINRKLSALHSFYQFLCRRNVGIMNYNPLSTSEGAIRFKNATRDYSDKRVLNQDEIVKMFKSAAKEGDIKSKRDLLVLQLLATTGMRRAELCGIKIGDITTMSGKHIAQITGKGNKQRFIVIADHIYELIKEYLNLRNVSFKDKDLPLIISHSSNADPTKHVDTVTIYRIVKKHADQAGVDASTISAHSFRTTFATKAYGDLGYDMDTLRELMGHSSSATTRRYAKTVKMLENNPAEELANMYKI